MRVKLTKLVAGVAALAALAVGGSALASAGTQATKAKPASSIPSQPETVAADDTDTIQQGDQADSTIESAGSEVAGNDGPGGHADEPGNANADNQFEGSQ